LIDLGGTVLTIPAYDPFPVSALYLAGAHGGDHAGGPPQVTQWLRHPARGWVVPKRVEYTHGRSGLLEQVVRVDRVGGVEVSSQTDLSRNGLDQPTGEANSGGPLSGLGVGMGYDAFGRLTSAGFPGHESPYQYDTGGRVWKVGGGSQWAEQIYQPNSWLVGEVKHRSAGGALTLRTRRAHDYLGRVTRVENRPGSLEAGTFDREYQFDLGGRRVEEGFPDGSRWRYGYDSQGRLASGRKEWADGGPVAGQQFEYGHDDAGNRTLRRWGGNASGQGLRESVETVNGANQVVSRETWESDWGCRFACILAMGWGPSRDGERRGFAALAQPF